MTVHIGELHTDVRTSDSDPAVRPAEPGCSREDLDQYMREERCRAEWLSRRVAAEGFDD